MIDIFHISKLIIKKRLNILTDLEKETLNNVFDENVMLKEIKTENLIDSLDSFSLINKDIAWGQVESKMAKRKRKSSFKIFKNPVVFYRATAIFVGIIASVYFLNTKTFDTFFNESILASGESDVILPGSSKAVLTLEEGTLIELAKGESFQTTYAKSNGECIAYNSNQKEVGSQKYNYITVPRGGQFSVELSDGTKVWLNSESQLKYPIAFNDTQTRQVELVYGEAYFDVSPSTNHKGMKFKVLNGSQEVEVLGTEFNIKAYKNETNVYTTLVEGKVVVTNELSKQNLVPNQQAVFDIKANNITISQIEVADEISWKKGLFSFDNKNLKDVMDVMARWYDIEVVFKNKELETIQFVGVLDKQQNIEEILSILKSTSINNYEIKNRTILLE